MSSPSEKDTVLLLQYARCAIDRALMRQGVHTLPHPVSPKDAERELCNIEAELGLSPTDIMESATEITLKEVNDD